MAVIEEVADEAPAAAANAGKKEKPAFIPADEFKVGRLRTARRGASKEKQEKKNTKSARIFDRSKRR